MMNLIGLTVVVFGFFAHTLAFGKSPSTQVKVKATVTIIDKYNNRILNEKTGTLTLFNPYLARGSVSLNGFSFYVTNGSEHLRVAKIADLHEQIELYELLTGGVSVQNESGATQLGHVQHIELVLRQQELTLTQRSWRLAYSTLISADHDQTSAHWTVESAKVHLVLGNMSSGNPETKELVLPPGKLDFFVNFGRNFRDARSPEEFRYFAIHSDGQTLTPVLPIGESSTGKLLFVDEFDLEKAILSGGDVTVYEDTRHFIQVLLKEDFDLLSQKREGLSSLLDSFDEAGHYPLRSQNHDALTEMPLRMKQLQQGAFRIRKLALRDKLANPATQFQKFLANCSIAFQDI